MKYLMGIDEGTTGCKAVLFSEEGKSIASSSREYPCYYPHPGWVEQDIEEIKSNVFSACKETVKKSGVNPNDIVGVSHSNQGITMVLLDENENPIMKHTIGWQDLRHTAILNEVAENIDKDEYFQISGMNFGTYNIPVLNWLQKYKPDVWKKVRHICSHQDFFLKQYSKDYKRGGGV